MALYDVEQYFDDVFDKFRKGTAQILNPELLVVTVDGDHGGRNRYVKFSGNSYELAEIQINGTYGENSTERTFMYDLYWKVFEDYDGVVKPIFRNNMTYDRHLRGWWVDWEAICKQLTDVCIVKLMPVVSAEQPPVKSTTQKKKNKYNYGGNTLYASGQLVQSIVVEKV